MSKKKPGKKPVDLEACLSSSVAIARKGVWTRDTSIGLSR
jgi:hypothetical protein